MDPPYCQKNFWVYLFQMKENSERTRGTGGGYRHQPEDMNDDDKRKVKKRSVPDDDSYAHARKLIEMGTPKFLEHWNHLSESDRVKVLASLENLPPEMIPTNSDEAAKINALIKDHKSSKLIKVVDKI
ncbi:unnamed protein product, partial [Allacma fusca]